MSDSYFSNSIKIINLESDDDYAFVSETINHIITNDILLPLRKEKCADNHNINVISISGEIGPNRSCDFSFDEYANEFSIFSATFSMNHWPILKLIRKQQDLPPNIKDALNELVEYLTTRSTHAEQDQNKRERELAQKFKTTFLAHEYN